MRDIWLARAGRVGEGRRQAARGQLVNHCPFLESMDEWTRVAGREIGWKECRVFKYVLHHGKISFWLPSWEVAFVMVFSPTAVVLLQRGLPSSFLLEPFLSLRSGSVVCRWSRAQPGGWTARAGPWGGEESLVKRALVCGRRARMATLESPFFPLIPFVRHNARSIPPL